MAFTKVIAGPTPDKTKILSAKDARTFFKKVEVHFPDGAKFTITGYQIVQFAKPGETVASPDARRHIVLLTNVGELMLSALWAPKQQLDPNDATKPAIDLYPDGTFTKRLDELIDNFDGDIEEFIEKNIEALKQFKLKARRKAYYGSDLFNRRQWLKQLNIDIDA